MGGELGIGPGAGIADEHHAVLEERAHVVVVRHVVLQPGDDGAQSGCDDGPDRRCEARRARPLELVLDRVGDRAPHQFVLRPRRPRRLGLECGGPRLGQPAEHLDAAGLRGCRAERVHHLKGDVLVVWVGDGSAAASGALLVMYYGNEIYLICNKLNVKDRLEEQVRKSGINILERNGIREIQGKEKVEQIVLKDGRDLKVEGVFIELGSKGAVELLSNLGVVLDDSGFIKTNQKQETNITGIFAAGDVCGPPFQVAKAVGEGCIAGLNASNYVKNIE